MKSSFEVHLINASGYPSTSSLVDVEADDIIYDRDFIKFYNRTGLGIDVTYPQSNAFVAVFPVTSVRYIIRKGNNKNAESEITRTGSTKAVA